MAVAVVAVGLVVAAGCAQPSAGAAPGGSVDSAPNSETASLQAAESMESAAAASIVAGVELAAQPSAADAVSEPAVVSSSAPEDELYAELRAHLSARSGQRSAEASSDASFEQVLEVVPLSAKLADAQLRTPELAALSVASAVQATPKPRVKTPTPKPAPKVVAKKSTPTPKPVVRAVATPKPATPKPAVTKTATTTVAPSAIGQRVVSIAMSYVGYRYRWGGASPSTGFDCRGFTYWVYQKAGRPIPITLAGQYGTGRWISRSALQPGDLVFFQNTYKAGLSHVGIYIGNGRMVNAQDEDSGVTTASINSSYWGPRYLGARRP